MGATVSATSEPAGAGLPEAGGAGAAEVPEGAFAAAREFIDGVTWGDHRKVWDLLAGEGRAAVLEVASARGMDDAQVIRLREGTGSEAETDEFLVDLVNGLRADLAGNDLDSLEYHADALPTEAGQANVVIHVPLHPALGGTLPVATLQLLDEAGTWRVERLVPFTSK